MICPGLGHLVREAPATSGLVEKTWNQRKPGSRLSLSLPKQRSVTEWHVPCEPVEPPLPMEPRIAPSAMEQHGLLEMWHAKKYEVAWVTFDGKVLYIYGRKEDHFSSQFLTVSSIRVVMEKEASKFGVSTQRHELIFRAESKEEHDKWLYVLRRATSSQRECGLPVLSESNIEKSGTLTLKELKAKQFVVIADDRTWVFKNREDFTDGFGVLSITMNIAKVRKGSRGTLEVITPYRTFCFSAGSEREAEEWVSSLTRVTEDALSSDEVAERIWSLPENQLCADCGSPQPKWVSVNLVAVICSSCAGQHRSLGPSISNVKSLRLDSVIWTEPLIQLFVQVGNKGASEIWALNVPPSEMISPTSLPEDRHQFIYAKYREGKFRRFHQLFGEQKQLDEALCQAVLSDDNISETMLLVFSGANVTCHSDQPSLPTPIALAEEAGQLLQLEFLKQNEHKATPSPDPLVSPAPLSPANSSKRGQSKRNSQDHFPLQIQGSKLCFYDNHSQEPTYSMELQEIIVVAKGPLGKWLEIQTPTDRHRCQASTQGKAALLLQSIAQALLSHKVHDISVVVEAERLTRIRILDGRFEEGQEAWALLRPKDLTILSTMLKETCPFSSILDINFNLEESLISFQTMGRLWELKFLSQPEFYHWCSVLWDIISLPESRSTTSFPGAVKVGVNLMNRGAVPLPMFRCLQYLNQYGLKTDGIYRQCSKKSRLDDLLAALKREATKLNVKLSDYTVHEVAGAFKHLLREMDPEDLFTEEHSSQWMKAADVKAEKDRVQCYRTLLDCIPFQNKELLKAIFAHLHSVHLQSSVNKMTAHNLSMVFAPTLFNTGQGLADSTRLLEDFITHYQAIFNAR